VGAADSTLVDAPLARGHHEVAVLDAAPHILVDLPDGQMVRCRVVNAKDDGTPGLSPRTPWRSR
jgi:hypothetical protein